MKTKKSELHGPPIQLSGPYLLNRIKSQCTECEDCGTMWHWPGKRYGQLTLLINVGKKMLSVRRVVHAITNGKPGPKGHVITTLCHNDRCMNPALIAYKPWTYIVKRSVAAGKIHTRQARIKATRTVRAKPTKIRDLEHANAIRMDSRSLSQIAAEVGVSREMIRVIKNNKRWVDYGGMFSGLMA